MAEITGASSSAVAPASHQNLAVVTVAPPGFGAAQIPDAVRTPGTFWTICDKCSMGFEYQNTYKDHLIICPGCHDPLVPKKVRLDSILGKEAVAKRRRAAPKMDMRIVYKDKLAATNVDVEALPHTGNNVSMLENIQPPRYQGMSKGDYRGFIKPIDKRKSPELMKPLVTDYKTSEDECFEKTLKTREIRKKASPEDVFSELKKIPDLAREDLLKAYNILRHDNFQFRSLIALPMELRKEWLLMEIASK